MSVSTALSILSFVGWIAVLIMVCERGDVNTAVSVWRDDETVVPLVLALELLGFIDVGKIVYTDLQQDKMTAMTACVVHYSRAYIVIFTLPHISVHLVHITLILWSLTEIVKHPSEIFPGSFVLRRVHNCAPAFVYPFARAIETFACWEALPFLQGQKLGTNLCWVQMIISALGGFATYTTVVRTAILASGWGPTLWTLFKTFAPGLLPSEPDAEAPDKKEKEGKTAKKSLHSNTYHLAQELLKIFAPGLLPSEPDAEEKPDKKEKKGKTAKKSD
jgi:hypothetical protein